MTWVAGDSFFLRIDNSHLYFLLHEPIDGAVVVVNFTSVRGSDNPACLIHPGEHPFINAPTTVAFHRAGVATTEKLTEFEVNDALRRFKPVSEKVRARILEAIRGPVGLEPFLPVVREFLQRHKIA